MKTAQLKETSHIKRDNSFFHNEERQPFFDTAGSEKSFFGAKTNTIQRQPRPDESVTKVDKPEEESTPSTPTRKFGRAGKCNSSPEFPNFTCLTQALKLDIDENLWNNAHQFYRVASLYPGDNQLMLDTFLRYGLGANLLQTSFGFLGANKKLATVLSYGTGVGLKSYEFLKSGKLELDVPIPLGKGVNLDL
ncbi:MAG: hypothetical protein ABI683_15580, partial [Ginsengibacter sp.]